MSANSTEASASVCAYSEQRLKMKLAVTPKSTLEEVLQICDEIFLQFDPPKQLMKERLLEICSSNLSATSHIMNVCNDVRCSYDYICVIDFEATCEGRKGFYPHEIIEFPAALIDTSTHEIIDVFHSYCKPSVFPHLSDYCRNLTGIDQSDVDAAKDFPSVLLDFEQWIQQHTKSFVIATDGPCDINRFLVTQCLISGVHFPLYAMKWIDIKTVYQKSYELKKGRLIEMLSSFGMSFLGKLHCGKDDAENIARLVIAMLKDGCRFETNGVIKKSLFLSFCSKDYSSRLRSS